MGGSTSKNSVFWILFPLKNHPMPFCNRLIGAMEAKENLLIF
jgi:hypothetical protein